MQTKQCANGTTTFPTGLPFDSFRKKIEKYSFMLCDRIGKGFSSTVYKGLNDLTSETVAIKVIELKSLKDDIAKSMLDSEIQCMRNLSNKNLLKFIESFTTQNNCYIITEYCDEGDMHSKMKQKGKYNEAEIKELMKQIVKGYACMSRMGYLHRDLKPANILVKGGVLKIADFGFVKKITGSIVKQSYNVGTPLYMSPQAMKHNIYTVKNDIWSMGVICYEMLAGKAPWQCRSQAQLKQKVAKNIIKFDGLQASNSLKDFIVRCLEVDQSKRLDLDGLQNHIFLAQPEIELNKFQINVEHKQRFTDFSIGRYVPRDSLKDNPQSPDEDEEESIIQVRNTLVSMLNMCRFNYKLQRRLQNCQGQKIEKVLTSLQSDLYNKMNLHEHIVRTGNNILKDKNWLAFLKSDHWFRYKDVVKCYSIKFDISRIQFKQCGNLREVLKSAIREMAMCDLDTADVLNLDYLVTYYQLSDMWQRFGSDYKSFALHSQVDEICAGRVEEKKINKHHVLNQIRRKITDLAI